DHRGIRVGAVWPRLWQVVPFGARCVRPGRSLNLRKIGVFLGVDLSPERDSRVTDALRIVPFMHVSIHRMARGLTGLAAAAVIAFLAAAAPAQAANDARPPVVVELFTSQGCSSCPPADKFLTELAMRSNVIALSLHVDYWDYIGWKDPFGSPMMTERQRRYASALGLRYVFTPQMIIDGRDSIVGSDRIAVESAIVAARARDKAVRVSLRPDGGGVVVIAAGQAPKAGATVWQAIYDADHETVVKRGENAGRTIRDVNVVRSLERLGTWTGEELEIPLSLGNAAARGRYGCVVIVQEGRSGPIIGAAVMMLDTLAQAQ
ncbi:MAG: DUF1223 domain-containing protein, partial [Alphaproteobacteria bacterium]